MINQKHGIPFVDAANIANGIRHPDEVLNLSDGPAKSKRISHIKGSIERFPLTDHFVQTLQVGEKENIIGDSQNCHLVLRTRPTGSKTWYFNPGRDGGKRQRIGTIAEYSAAEARIKAGWIHAEREQSYKRPVRRLPIETTLTEAAQKYFKQDMATCKGRPGLFKKYLLLENGDRALSKLEPRVWFLAVDKAGFDNSSRAHQLHTTLKAFLFWSSERGLVKSNPLARTSPPFPLKYEPAPLCETDVRAIYDAAQNIGWPWSALFGLTMLTGQPMEYVRHIQNTDIDWNNGIWLAAHGENPDHRPKPSRSSSLGSRALALLEPGRTSKGYIFQSVRTPLSQPIHVYSEIISRIKHLSGVDIHWRIKDIRGRLKSFTDNYREEIIDL